MFQAVFFFLTGALAGFMGRSENRREVTDGKNFRPPFAIQSNAQTVRLVFYESDHSSEFSF
jgi:hypothetical protein